MSIAYILIVLAIGGSGRPALTSAEFADKASCNQAAQLISAEFQKRAVTSYNVSAGCFPKSSSR